MTGLGRTVVALALAGAVAGLAAACAGPPVVTVPAGEPPLVLERDLAGRSVGTGRFESGIAGVERTFRISTDGRWDGRTLTLREDLAFDDGQRQTLTWRFTKVGEGRYEGRREDVIGVADVRATPEGTVRLRYTADVENADGTTTRLTFDDVLARQDARTILNRATVSRFGIPVGTVEVVFRRR